MKIGKYILAGLLMAAVVLPASAQDKQYDVKLTVYPKEEQVKEGKKEKKEKERTLREEYREHKKAEKHERRFRDEPVEIKSSQSGKPHSSVRPVEVEPASKSVRPVESYDPVVAPCSDKEEVCCDEACDKPCCEEKPCDMPCGRAAFGPGPAMCPMMSPCGMPMFGNSAQYRDYKKMMRGLYDDFYGNAFYMGTNALAYLALAPNLSMEWRRDEKRSFRLSLGGFYNPWTDQDSNEHTYGFWVTPELRWYMGEKKSWYLGPMVQFGFLGRSLDGYDYSGYGGVSRYNERYMAISGGGTFGYMHKLRRNFAIDYNVSVGVSAIGHYDGYYAGATTDWKCAFSITNIGVSLVWQTCKKPLKVK